MKKIFAGLIGCFVTLSALGGEADYLANLKPELVIKRAQTAASFKGWTKAEEKYEGSALRNAANQRPGPKDLCATMKSVGLGCSYLERGYIVTYLFAHGVNLFPCQGGTNPYTKDMCGKVGDDPKYEGLYNYIGQPIQNKMLKESIEKNRKLFRKGDLSAASAAKWKK